MSSLRRVARFFVFALLAVFLCATASSAFVTRKEKKKQSHPQKAGKKHLSRAERKKRVLPGDKRPKSRKGRPIRRSAKQHKPDQTLKNESPQAVPKNTLTPEEEQKLLKEQENRINSDIIE